MRKVQIRNFIDAIISTILNAGKLATQSQGKVVNIGKDINLDESGDERIKQRGSSKTEIDEKVQEMLLSSIKQTLGTKNIIIDAEEETPSVKLFQSSNNSISIIIDPLDGTLEYISGSDRYSINVGLIKNGIVLTTLIYFPKSRYLYYLDENRIPLLNIFSKDLELEKKEELKAPRIINKNTLYTNNRVPADNINKLRKSGFKVVEDDGKVGWPDALLKCISGEYTASIFHSPQARDVLLGVLIEMLPSGYMIDWNGDKIQWPKKGRIPRVIFGFGSLPQILFECLRE